MTSVVPDEARALLRAVMHQHSNGNIEPAIEAARGILQRWPEYAQARSYLGQTLVTRQRLFSDGLDQLARAAADAPQDAYILYTYGWCEEFVANALASSETKPKGGPHQFTDRSADDLYGSAKAHFLSALQLEPDDQLLGDIEDMLTVIAQVTGEPWDGGEEVTRAQPRPR